eukprot:scaffold102129_cov38-Cyclotella_meneghiniana.AAC.3
MDTEFTPPPANASSADYQNRSSVVMILIPPDQTTQYITEKHTTDYNVERIRSRPTGLQTGGSECIQLYLHISIRKRFASQTGSIAPFSSFAINSIRGMMDYSGNQQKKSSKSSYEKQFSTSWMSTLTKGFDSCCRSNEFQVDALAENDEAKQCACVCVRQ